MKITSTKDCSHCKGTGNDPFSRTNVPLDAQFAGETVELDEVTDYGSKIHREYELDYSREPELVSPCWKCKGYKVVMKDGWNAFKSEQTAKRFAKTAKKCNICFGMGSFWYFPTISDCIHCDGIGQEPVFVVGDTHIPENVGLTNYADKENFMKPWVENVEITFVADKNWTWQDMHLGMGGLYSLTDYGEMAKLIVAEGIDAAKAKIIEKISNDSSQFCKFVDRETRQISNLLVIRVGNMGYQPIPAIRNEESIELADKHVPMLPPTYTDEVLNRKMN